MAVSPQKWNAVLYFFEKDVNDDVNQYQTLPVA